MFLKIIFSKTFGVDILAEEIFRVWHRSSSINKKCFLWIIILKHHSKSAVNFSFRSFFWTLNLKVFHSELIHEKSKNNRIKFHSQYLSYLEFNSYNVYKRTKRKNSIGLEIVFRRYRQIAPQLISMKCFSFNDFSKLHYISEENKWNNDGIYCDNKNNIFLS